MSEMELNKGTLIPVGGIDIEDYSEEDLDALYCEGFAVIDGDVFQVKWEVQHAEADIGFADVVKNEDGSISFHTLHYNGGAHWDEVVEEELKRQCKKGDKKQ